MAPYPATEFTLPTVDIKEVDRARVDSQSVVIDVRAAFRYQGESEPIDPIAGHIPGAINVPLSENLDNNGCFQTAKQLRARYAPALEDASRCIVHCGSGVTACHTLLALHLAGFEGAELYVGSWSEWCRNARPRLP